MEQSINVIPINSLSQFDINLLDSCVWKNIRFLAKMNPMTQIENGHTYYNCSYCFCKNNDKDVICKYRRFRYSDLKTLCDYLVSKYQDCKTLNTFPGKHWWGNRTKPIIDERIKGFNEFFGKITTILDLDNDSEVKKFFDITI